MTCTHTHTLSLAHTLPHAQSLTTLFTWLVTNLSKKLLLGVLLVLLNLFFLFDLIQRAISLNTHCHIHVGEQFLACDSLLGDQDERAR